MTNLFKTRFLPNPDGTESTTALTNANTVFIHTYLGDDSTGDGTREKPYRSMTKALTKASTYILFRGLINEAFTLQRIVIGDDMSQYLEIDNYTVPSTSSFTITTLTISSLNLGFSLNANKQIRNVIVKSQYSSTTLSLNNTFQYVLCRTLSVAFSNNNWNIAYMTINLIIDKNPVALSVKNTIFTGLSLTNNITNSISNTISYCVFTSRTIFKYFNGLDYVPCSPQPIFSNISKDNINAIRDSYINGTGSGSVFSAEIMNKLLMIDIFGNETCIAVNEEYFGGSNQNIFNKFEDNITTTISSVVSAGYKTTISLANTSLLKNSGDIVFIGSDGKKYAFTYTSKTSTSIAGPSQFLGSAPIGTEIIQYGDVLDYTLNPDPQNEALWASQTGGYVGCFRPAYACDVETGLSAISNVDENGTNSGSGDLVQIVNGELKFNSASSQLWNRMSDTTTINIPNGSNFKGLNAMSQDGSPFGYYIGKKQTLISPTAIVAGNALTVGKWYKVYNDNGNSVSEAILYNGVQYLPEYTFLCITGVTTFSELEPGSGSYVKEILSGVLESIEILPYNDMTTPSTFPKFSAPLMGECKLIFYTASGAARYGKTAGDPVKFADLALANMITDFGTVKNKISYYNNWAISNADSEFYLLTNAGLSTTLKGYFTQDIPAIKYLRREINGHFDMPYDY